VWVAEVWLDWELCRGSTLYRERFDDFDDAGTSAKKAAKDLDWVLANRVFGIRWGVRRASKADNGLPIWSPHLPGSRNFCGERFEFHPFNKETT